MTGESGEISEQNAAGPSALDILAIVPEEQAFLCLDGQTFRSLKELADGLNVMSDVTFADHVNVAKNDFSNWVRNELKDETLADNLATTSVRAQAVWFVTTRLSDLCDSNT